MNASSKKRILEDILFARVDASTLGTYRIIFGFMMLVEVIRYFAFDTIREYYIQPQFLFTFEGFAFLGTPSEKGIYGVFWALGLFSIGILLGCFYRFCCIGFFFGYTYIFLLDKANYNNHYYLMSLLTFLFCISDAHRWLSIDKKRNIKSARADWIPFWQHGMFSAQFFIVYFYGGLAKINLDWLTGNPLRNWFTEFRDVPLMGALLQTEGFVYFVSYSGLLFDLFIPFLLLWKRFRWLALFLLLFFHVGNSWLFSIGIFPWLAFLSSLLFFEPNWARCVYLKLQKKFPKIFRIFCSSQANFPKDTPPIQKGVLSFLLLYFVLQILLPFRHWLYQGPVNWTEEGQKFSWRMKLRDKQCGNFFFYEWQSVDQKTIYSWTLKFKEDSVYSTWYIQEKSGSKIEEKEIKSIRPSEIKEQLLHYLKTYPPAFKPRTHFNAITLTITDSRTNKSWIHRVEEDLNWQQTAKMVVSPDMLWQYVQYLKKKLVAQNIERPLIYADTWVSMNNRPFQRMVDPTFNLAEAPYFYFRSSHWILPLTEEEPAETALDIWGTFLAFGIALLLFFLYLKQHSIILFSPLSRTI